MEQRILQYRKSIDEWLEKTEQSAQVSQEILRDKMEEHLNQIGFFQHEKMKSRKCMCSTTECLGFAR